MIEGLFVGGGACGDGCRVGLGVCCDGCCVGLGVNCCVGLDVGFCVGAVQVTIDSQLHPLMLESNKSPSAHIR